MCRPTGRSARKDLSCAVSGQASAMPARGTPGSTLSAGTDRNGTLTCTKGPFAQAAAESTTPRNLRPSTTSRANITDTSGTPTPHQRTPRTDTTRRWDPGGLRPPDIQSSRRHRQSRCPRAELSTSPSERSLDATNHPHPAPAGPKPSVPATTLDTGGRSRPRPRGPGPSALVIAFSPPRSARPSLFGRFPPALSGWWSPGRG
jgi:hypothetical protein